MHVYGRVCVYIYVTVYRYKHVVQGIYTCRRMFADIVRVYARTYVCMCAWYGMAWYGMVWVWYVWWVCKYYLRHVSMRVCMHVGTHACMYTHILR